MTVNAQIRAYADADRIISPKLKYWLSSVTDNFIPFYFCSQRLTFSDLWVTPNSACSSKGSPHFWYAQPLTQHHLLHIFLYFRKHCLIMLVPRWSLFSTHFVISPRPHCPIFAYLQIFIFQSVFFSTTTLHLSKRNFSSPNGLKSRGFHTFLHSHFYDEYHLYCSSCFGCLRTCFS